MKYLRYNKSVNLEGNIYSCVKNIWALDSETGVQIPELPSTGFVSLDKIM